MPITPLPTPTDWDLKQLERYDAGVRVRALVEMAIVRKLVTDLIAAGYTVTVDDGDDEPVKDSADVEAIMDAAFAVDECLLLVYKTASLKAFASVTLIFGNSGWDVISDHTTNLRAVMKPTDELVDAMSAWF